MGTGSQGCESHEVVNLELRTPVDSLNDPGSNLEILTNTNSYIIVFNIVQGRTIMYGHQGPLTRVAAGCLQRARSVAL